jgi:hypothetical protein
MDREHVNWHAKRPLILECIQKGPVSLRLVPGVHGGFSTRSGVLSQIFGRCRFGAWLVASVSVGRQEMIEFKGSHFEREVIL